ncbi:MAG: helix-turn-helix domain-containing protein [Bacteroidia bacterium]|nr:helix-turn-helix domain-containing protein [Bacteroidia bacterium]
MKDEEILRQQAIELHLKGMAIVDITDRLGKSRQWVHKWLNRYKSGDDKWYLSLSNAPKRPIKAVSEDIENTVVSIRQKLKDQKYAQKGALNILYEFERLNIKPPSLSTINRIIRRNGLIDRGTKREAKKKNILITSRMYNRWISWVPNILKVAPGITYLTLLLLSLIMPGFIPYRIRLLKV